MVDPFDLSSFEPETQTVPRTAPGSAPEYLSRLNEAQSAAVEATEGPLLVLAGAGTGKTRVLTTRLAHILRLRLAWPSQILAVTFTNKAARQMQAQVATLIGEAVEGLWLGTFHANGVRIIRRHAELVGLKSDFTILDVDDQLRLMKQVIAAANIDEKRWPARALAARIDRWKDRGLVPAQVSAAEAGDFANGQAVALYKAYQSRLVDLNAADFGDLLLHCVSIFTKNPDVLSDYQRRFKYILVDEYQDTNIAQYLWLRLLAQGHKNLCCVGDDDQSIYGWRGAEVDNILRFEDDFPGASVIRLERNYRSTPHILGAASGLIAHNEGRLGKTLWTEGEDGDKVIVHGVWDGEEEARVVGEEIEALQRHGHTLNAIAILVRAGFQTREFEDRFLTLGLPHRVIGGVGFYERREIRDAIAYLRVIHNEADDLAFARIINTPKRGIGQATTKTLHVLSRAEGISLVAAGNALVGTDELRPQSRGALARLLQCFDRWRAAAADLSLPDLIELTLDESGYTEMLKNDSAADSHGRLENLKELVAATEQLETLIAFLEHVSLVMDNDRAASEDAINLVTLHSAKGLEFDTVFLPGWEEGLFPHQRALDEGGTKALEEERRLAYVGLTRARQRIRVSFAASRRLFTGWQSNIPSRFIDELPAEHIENVSEPGLYGGPGGDLADAPSAFVIERPAFGRRRSRYARHVTSGGLVVEGHADAVRAQPSSAYTPGMRIFHQKFGYGRIVSVDDNRLEIEFEKAGRKKVIDSFVAPA